MAPAVPPTIVRRASHVASTIHAHRIHRRHSFTLTRRRTRVERVTGRLIAPSPSTPRSLSLAGRSIPTIAAPALP